jgi:hypothetical protein
MVGGGVRWLVGSTFTLSAKVHLRDARIPLHETQTAPRRAQEITVGAGIGNRWDFEHLFVSVD